MRLWRMQPFRCLDCHKRFHVPDCVAENIRLRKLRKRASVTQVTRPVDAVAIPGAVAEVLPS